MSADMGPLEMADGERNKLYGAWQKAVRRSFDWVDRPA